MDTTLYKTVEGRIVYGGGGVIPDEFVPIDTTMNSTLLFDIMKKSLISSYAIKFFTPNRINGKNFKECSKSISKLQLEDSFIKYCQKKDINWSNQNWETSKEYILNRLQAYILRVKFGNNGFYRKIAEKDHDIEKALDILTSSN